MNQIVEAKNVVPLAQINKFEDFIAAPAVRDRIAAVLPKHLNPERMMRTLALAAYKTPKLREVNMMSLLGAVMTCASMGFEPNTPLGHAYLIPFEKKKYDREKREYVTERVDVNVVFGYAGLIDLARRTGSLVAITAKIVYDGDDFDFEYGSNQHLRHRPKGVTEKRRPIYAYAHAKLTDGEAFEVLPYAEALAFRRYSQSWQTAQRAIEEFERLSDAEKKKNEWKVRSANDTPWIRNEAEMVQKTMIRRLSKWLPKNIEFAAAMTVDATVDAGRPDYAALATMSTGDAKGLLEGGVIPESEPDADDAPPVSEKKPEAEAKPKGGKAAKDAVKTATVQPKTEDPPAQDEPAQMSDELENGLSVLAKMTDVAEISGARESMKDMLSTAEYAVWNTAALNRQREIAPKR